MNMIFQSNSLVTLHLDDYETCARSGNLLCGPGNVPDSLTHYEVDNLVLGKLVKLLELHRL